MPKPPSFNCVMIIFTKSKRAMNRLIVVLIVILYGAVYSFAQQSINDARDRFDQGKYDATIKFCNELLIVYQDKGLNTSEVTSLSYDAKRCIQLKSEAERLSKKHSFTKAIGLYEQLLGINPQDPDAHRLIASCKKQREVFLEQKSMERDWVNAKDLTSLYAFRKKYPDSKYDKAAQEKINSLEIKADSDRWREANNTGTIELYEKYLANSSDYSRFVNEAKRRLAALYEKEGDNSAMRLKEYARALEYYEKSEEYGGMTYPSDVYEYCKFKARDGYKSNVRAIEHFLVRHPDSKYIEEIRGYWVSYLINYDNDFERARKVVQQGNINYYGEERTYAWWMELIKYKEKEYKKANRRSNRRQGYSGQRNRKSYQVTSKIVTLYVGDMITANIADGAVSRWEIDDNNKDYVSSRGNVLIAKKAGKIIVWGYVNDSPKLFSISIK